MAEFPALQLWTDAYLGDTGHLTTIEHGAYLLLLMTAWRTKDCSLPDDDKILARYCRMNTHQWARIKPIMLTFWKVENGTWRQSRLTDEWGAVRQKREAAASNGKLSALKRKGRHSTERVQSDNGASTTTATATATYSDTKVSGEIATAAPVQIDPTKVMFDAGVRLLGLGGVKEPAARALIGKWKRDHGESQVIAALGQAQRNGATDVVGFIEGCLRAGSRDRPRIGWNGLGEGIPC